MKGTDVTHFSKRLVAIVLACAALAGGGAGAALYSVVPRSRTHTTTAVAATPIARTTSQLTVAQVYARAAKGVVEVDVTTTQQTPFGGAAEVQAQGTGFVYDDSGDIVTNEHVIEGATSIEVKLASGATYTAKVVGSDASTDIAVLRIDAPSSALHPLTLGDSSAVSVGDGVVAIGDPFGLDGSVTSGIVSAVGRTITAPDDSKIGNAIQTDAAINHGNSGGPLLDLKGNVIGVTSQIESTSGGSDGVGFAVPSNTVKQVVSQLLAAAT